MKENMRAVVYREKGVFALEEQPVPKIQDPTDAIVKERSISKAADRLYLSQPYLSQYLAKLESNLGVTLLDRSHTPLRLTPAGELFYAYLERQDYLDRQLESDLRTLQSQKPQQLHIGVSTWRGSILLPDILPRFVQFYPEVQVVLHEAPVPQLGNLAASSVTVCSRST